MMKNGKDFLTVSNRAGRTMEVSREDFEKYGQRMGFKIVNTVNKKYDKPVDGKIEIVIVAYNNPECEKKAIEAVKRTTDVKLTVFDNYRTGLSLSQAWNKCIKESNADYICLLNNDAYVTEGWLDEMMKGFNDEKDYIFSSFNYFRISICRLWHA